MAFPAQLLYRLVALQSAAQASTSLKAKCAALRAKSAASGLTYYEIRDQLLPFLKGTKQQFADVAALPDVDLLAAAVTGVPAQDIADSFVAMSAALVGCIEWIEDTLPKSGGFLLGEAITTDGGGVVTPRQFTVQDTAGLRTELQAIEDAIA